MTYGAGLADRVRDHVPSVDAVLDVAGKGELPRCHTVASWSYQGDDPRPA